MPWHQLFQNFKPNYIFYSFHLVLIDQPILEHPPHPCSLPCVFDHPVWVTPAVLFYHGQVFDIIVGGEQQLSGEELAYNTSY